jgi:phage gp36-like protein
MAYTVYADIDNEISDLGQYIPAGKTALDWINNKIASAELEINAKLSSRYTTPVSPVPDILKACSLNLTCYYVLRQNYTQEDGNTSDWVNEYRKTSDELLKLIMDGTVDLAAMTTAINIDYAQSSTSNTARRLTSDTYSTDGEVLTDGTLADWIS